MLYWSHYQEALAGFKFGCLLKQFANFEFCLVAQQPGTVSAERIATACQDHHFFLRHETLPPPVNFPYRLLQGPIPLVRPLNLEEVVSSGFAGQGSHFDWGPKKCLVFICEKNFTSLLFPHISDQLWTFVKIQEAKSYF